MPYRRFLATAPLCAALLATSAWSATFIVNSTGDEPLGGPVHCNPGSTTCTLRAAIERANNWGGPDTIAFDFGGVPTTIALTQPLPLITSEVVIDGTTNGGTPNSAATGTNAVITVRIDGANAGASVSGVPFGPGASNSVLRGVAVTRFSYAGVIVTANNVVNGLSGVRIHGNFIGTDGSNSPDDVAGLLANQRGIAVLNKALSTRIGSDDADALANRNLIIATASGDGIANYTSNSQLRNNLIGTDRSGTVQRATGTAIAIGGNNNTVQGNVIGAAVHGVDITNESDWNRLLGNRIGVGADGVSAIAGSGHGVFIHNEGNINKSIPRYTFVGGTGAGEGNTIAHWGGNGIRLERNNTFVNYPQGHNWQGNSIHGNGALGIEIIDTAFNQGANPALPPPVWAQRPPMIGGATGTLGSTQINYTLMNADASANYRLEAFANTTCDPTGFGEGRAYLGAVQVQTFPSGSIAGTMNLPAMPGGHTHVTLTATRIGVNGYFASSEFSHCKAVQGNLPASTPPTVGPGSAAVQVNTLLSHDLAQYVAATDGDPILSYALVGTLPPGLGFNTSTGLLSGTPTAVGDHAFTLQATDKDGTASAPFALSVTAAPPPAPPPGTPPSVAPGSATVQAGQPLSHGLAQYVTATDGDPILLYVLIGDLPQGLVQDTDTGLLSGTTAETGEFPLLLGAQDKDGWGMQVFTLTVTTAGPGNGPITPVPTLGHAALALLSLLLAALGITLRRAR
ncbi:MAG: IPTL-CTERM sorting domain-containing protein [Ottowia sp.]|uniref:IPTL-CTERM sorting domain-containing protein n=1 Tax=Ottowia sp. TaxID=1898956 RepID=UPI0039E5F99E